MQIKHALLAGAFSVAATINAQASEFNELRAQAKGQTVYFNAWGGSEAINDYIKWAADEVESMHGFKVEQVKIDDTGAIVGRILVEKTAGNDQQGAVDLLWVNGENFHKMKSNGLLASPWTHSMPNLALTNPQDPALLQDFGVAVDAQELPWGRAQMVFFTEQSKLADAPRSAAQWLEYAKANPGRLSYPAPTQFHGMTFIKQILAEVMDDPSVLSKDASTVDVEALTRPLFDYLDMLHPLLWQEAKSFPKDAGAMLQMLDDGVLDIVFSFNPAAASQAISEGRLSESVRSYVFDGGTIGNTHFLAVPFNAKASAGAKVFANFLLSAKAQARKADSDVWGDPTVVDVAALSVEDKALFAGLERGVATLSPTELGTPLAEPHPSWVAQLERLWSERYQN